jgi:hypothetical protein
MSRARAIPVRVVALSLLPLSACYQSYAGDDASDGDFPDAAICEAFGEENVLATRLHTDLVVPLAVVAEILTNQERETILAIGSPALGPLTADLALDLHDPACMTVEATPPGTTVVFGPGCVLRRLGVAVVGPVVLTTQQAYDADGLLHLWVQLESDLSLDGRAAGHAVVGCDAQRSGIRDFGCGATINVSGAVAVTFTGTVSLTSDGIHLDAATGFVTLPGFGTSIGHTTESLAWTYGDCYPVGGPVILSLGDCQERLWYVDPSAGRGRLERDPVSDPVVFLPYDGCPTSR